MNRVDAYIDDPCVWSLVNEASFNLLNFGNQLVDVDERAILKL